MKSQPPQGTNGYDFSLAEPFIDDDGNPSVALIWNGRVNFWTIEDMKRDAELSEAGKWFEERYYSSSRLPWRYPSIPILPESLDDVWRLHVDIQRCNDQYIEFPDSAWSSVSATWLMGSYLVPFMDRSPVLLIFGPSESGKGQVLDQVDRLGYRGTKMISPTPAVMFRWTDRWTPTLALDELQDSAREDYRAVMNIVKGSYDGTPVFRCEPNSYEVCSYQTRGFMALSLKGSQPAEDIKNRGILFTMRRNEHPKALVPEDSDEHRELRARLVGLRLNMLTDRAFREEALRRVKERGRPEALGFDRRPRDIALSLLLPALLSGQEEELIETIRKSSDEAKDEDNTTFLARVHHCLEEEWESDQERQYISVLAVKDRVRYDMEGDGELKPNEKLATKRVTDAVKSLGYRMKRRTANVNFIDTLDKHNLDAYETNRKRYPLNREE